MLICLEGYNFVYFTVTTQGNAPHKDINLGQVKLSNFFKCGISTNLSSVINVIVTHMWVSRVAQLV
jgi:hypothetical protein